MRRDLCQQKVKLGPWSPSVFLSDTCVSCVAVHVHVRPINKMPGDEEEACGEEEEQPATSRLQ